MNLTTLPTFTAEVSRYQLSTADGEDGKPYARLSLSVVIRYTTRKWDRHQRQYVESEWTKSYPGWIRGKRAEEVHQMIEAAGGIGCLMTLQAVFIPSKPFEGKDKDGQKTSVVCVNLEEIQVLHVDAQEAMDDVFDF